MTSNDSVDLDAMEHHIVISADTHCGAIVLQVIALITFYHSLGYLRT